MKRYRPFFVTLGVLLVLLYLIGGMSGVRTLRARYRAWTEPPTAAEMARASAEAPTALPAMPTRTPDGRKIPVSDPATIGDASKIISGVLVVAVGLMFITARDAKQS
jgi:hypothetical protein